MPDLAQTGGFTPIEARLAPLERIIERGISTFIEVGQALLKIRDEQLYRASYETFDDYLDARWGVSPAHGYRLIDAAKVIDAISPVGDTPAPRSEAVARELAPVLHREGPKVAASAWRRTVAEYGPEPTAAEVRSIVRGNSSPKSRSERARALTEEQRKWVGQLQRFIETHLGDDPLPQDVRAQIAVGALPRARAAVSVLEALAEGDPPDLNALDAVPKFAEEARDGA